MNDDLDAATVVAPDGEVLLAAGHHGVSQAWPWEALRQATPARIFPLPATAVVLAWPYALSRDASCWPG
jgi:hypothetical protein